MKALVVFSVLSYLTVSFKLTSSEVIHVVANRSIYRTPGFGYAHFTVHPNSKLELENPGNFHAQTYKQCAIGCVKNRTCLSFNVGKQPIFYYQGKAHYLCEILSTDKYNSSSKFQSVNPDFIHYSIRSNCSKSPCLHNFTCLHDYTADTYECLCPSTQFEGKDCKGCQDSPVGIANSSIIPDERFTTNSPYTYDVGVHAPKTARLNCGGAHGWASRTANDLNAYLQLDLGQLFIICAVATQGCNACPEWTTQYKISTSVNGSTWTTYKDGNTDKLFTGNTDMNTVVLNVLDVHILVRFIRFIPTTFYKWKTMRVEAYGLVKAG